MSLGGQPSVEDLDERWGSRWRHGAEFQFYSRRKVVVTEIKRLVAGGREAREVVDSLEAERVRAKASLSQVINGLKAAAKARDGGNGCIILIINSSMTYLHSESYIPMPPRPMRDRLYITNSFFTTCSI